MAGVKLEIVFTLGHFLFGVYLSYLKYYFISSFTYGPKERGQYRNEDYV